MRKSILLFATVVMAAVACAAGSACVLPSKAELPDSGGESHYTSVPDGSESFYESDDVSYETEWFKFTLLDDGSGYSVSVCDDYNKKTYPKNLTIPSEINNKPVKSVGEQAFADCFGLESVEIPEGITSIRTLSFSGCRNLTSVTMLGVKYIGDGAFEDCPGLTSVVLSDGLISIGEWAFGYCESLTSIVIPSGVTSIGDNAFSNCRSLASVTFDGTVEQWNRVQKGYYWMSGANATTVQCSDGNAPL